MEPITLSGLYQEDLDLPLVGTSISEEEIGQLLFDEDGNSYKVNVVITRGDMI